MHSDNRMRSLDTLLLFMTTVLGLSFSVVNVLFAQKETVYGFLPLLIIGVVMPVYIGYIRGAIILDTLEERLRGWVYFLNGVFQYVAAVTLWIVARLADNLGVEFQVFSRLVMFVGYAVASYSLGAGHLRKWFCRTMLRAFDASSSQITDKIFEDTADSSVFTGSVLFANFVASSILFIDVSSTLALAVLLSTISVAYFALSEKNIRKWIDLLQFSDFVEIETRWKKVSRTVRISRFVLLTIMLGAIVLWIVGALWDALLRIGLSLISICAAIVFAIWCFPKKSTSIKTKGNIPRDIEDKLAVVIERINKPKNS